MNDQPKKRTRRQRDPEESQMVGLALLHLRRQAGMTVRQLSEASGQPVAALNRYEEGHSLPRTETLRRIVEAMGATMLDLFRAQQRAIDHDSHRERRQERICDNPTCRLDRVGCRLDCCLTLRLRSPFPLNAHNGQNQNPQVGLFIGYSLSYSLRYQANRAKRAMRCVQEPGCLLFIVELHRVHRVRLLAFVHR